MYHFVSRALFYMPYRHVPNVGSSPNRGNVTNGWTSKALDAGGQLVSSTFAFPLLLKIGYIQNERNNTDVS